MIIDCEDDDAGAAAQARLARRTERMLTAVAIAAAIAAWLFYLGEDLILSHYDARAHLVVARRVLDNITPGWQQIGAVWLPLPHLILLLPVQLDVFYRTGAFGSLVSIACFGITTWAAARLILRITGSRLGAATTAALLVLNPNIVYLHATPMTEPLLAACTFLGVLWLYEWAAGGRDDVPRGLGVALAAAVWTRFEAWAIVAAALAATAYVLWRRGLPAGAVVRRTWRVARWPAAALAVFLLNSRITVGEWFVSGGFFVPDPTYQGQAWRALVAIWWGTHELSGYVNEIVALATAAAITVVALARRSQAALLLPVSLLAAAALPFVAFYEGHPFRIRYMVPLVMACALFGGLAVGWARRVVPGTVHRPAAGAAAAWLVCALLVGSAFVEAPPWQEAPPLLSEAQWDVPHSLNRRAVTACLGAYRDEKIVASMGSLAHYMQELSRAGFDIADFVHEGTGTIWDLVLETRPAIHAGWMLVEEQAEGGDVLAQRIRRDARFVEGMVRVCEGGGVALYARSKVKGQR